MIARNGEIAMAIICDVAGIACFIPWISVSTKISIMVGILLIAYGIIRVLGYFSGDLYCLAFQYGLACGLFMIVAGGAILIFHRQLIPYLATGIGAMIFMDGLLMLQTARDAKGFGLETWPLLLTLAITTGILGAVVLVIPSGAAEEIMAGIALLAEGIMTHAVVICPVKNIDWKKEGR